MRRTRQSHIPFSSHTAGKEDSWRPGSKAHVRTATLCCVSNSNKVRGATGERPGLRDTRLLSLLTKQKSPCHGSWTPWPSPAAPPRATPAHPSAPHSGRATSRSLPCHLQWRARTSVTVTQADVLPSIGAAAAFPPHCLPTRLELLEGRGRT